MTPPLRSYVRNLRDLWRFSFHRGRGWLIPILLALVLAGALLAAAKVTVVSPYVYTLF